MARLRYLDQKDLSAEDQDLLLRPINLNRILIHSPAGRRAGLGMANFIRHSSKLDPRLRELAILQVGYLAGAAYEWSHHIKIGKDFGVSEDDIHALIAVSHGKPSALDDQASIVLAAAREMTLDGAVSQDTFSALRGFLDDERLVELIITLAHYNGTVRLLATLEVDVEDEYLPYLKKFPLPLHPIAAGTRRQ